MEVNPPGAFPYDSQSEVRGCAASVRRPLPSPMSKSDTGSGDLSHYYPPWC